MTNNQNINIKKDGEPTLKDLAQACGLSVAAVRWALSGDNKHVSDDKRNNVLKIAEEMGYDLSTNQAARRMGLRRQGQKAQGYLIALFFPEEIYQSTYFSLFYHGLLSVLQPNRYGILIYSISDSENNLLPRAIDHGDVDGAIIYSPDNSQDLLSQLQQHKGFSNHPIISVYNSLPDTSFIGIDDYIAGKQACNHLIELGHKKICHFFNDNSTIHVNRLKGCRDACIESGLNPEKTLVKFSFNDFNKDPKSCIILLHKNTDITAIITPNDLYANLLIHECLKSGIKIPEDCSVIGFDDNLRIPEISNSYNISTIRLPLFDVGKTAGELILKQITSQKFELENIILPSTLIVREGL